MTSNGKSDKTGKPTSSAKAKPKASKKDIKEWQESLSDIATQCRDLKHNWFYQSAERSADGFIRQLGCITCGAFKLQHLDRSGYILKTSYEYPEGYVRPAGAGRVTQEENAQMRLLAVKKQARG